MPIISDFLEDFHWFPIYVYTYTYQSSYQSYQSYTNQEEIIYIYTYVSKSYTIIIPCLDMEIFQKVVGRRGWRGRSSC